MEIDIESRKLCKLVMLKPAVSCLQASVLDPDYFFDPTCLATAHSFLVKRTQYNYATQASYFKLVNNSLN